MEYVKDPAKQATAITDLILAAVALGGIFFLHRGPTSHNDFLRMTIWSAAVGSIGSAAFLGAAAHGLVLAPRLNQRLWRILNLTLALAGALFVVGVVFDLWGKSAAGSALPLMLLIGLGFYTATLLYPGIFFLFIIYGGLVLIFALGAYVFLSLQGEFEWAWLMAAGILVSIIAAVIQTKKSISLKLIWQFDHNGIYHLVQTVGLIMLLIGLRCSVVS
jgi:hypothetical protein